MPACSQCSQVLKCTQKTVTCRTCEKVFHPACASLNDADLQLLEDASRAWNCATYIAKCRSTRGDDTPIKALDPGSLYDKSQREVYNPILKELLDRVKVIQENQSEFVNSIKNDISELKKVISTWESLINEHSKTISLISESLSNISGKLDGMVAENEILLKRVANLEAQLNTREQDSLRNVLEIHGIPFKSGEVLETLVCQVGLGLGVKLEASDVDYAYRLKARPNLPNNRPPSIRVRFMRSNSAREILEARKAKRSFSTRDIGLSDSPNYPIYVNESLSALNRKVYAKARELKKNGKLKCLWIRGGKIFARECDGSELLLLRTEGDLHALQ
ncbi:uncharacterized protein LOC124158230 [Ischnura elegans]|uniref:uncharacterized protein LOC124158230 n=1 Tax=Ischnura elegans TaxID=197161 RepID=UPI001ED87F4A|nr:uncharacterized protein LOC124158230 [Ischnura elegans]